MGKAIVYVAVTGAGALISFLWYVLDRGNPALLVCIASLLATGIAAPILLRKDFQFVGIPGPFEILFALGALAAAILGGLKGYDAGAKGNPYWFWLAVVVQSIPCIRISLVSLKAFQRPPPLKVAVGIGLAALFGLNLYLGVKHSEWLGKTSVALVKEWFPEATAPVARNSEGKPEDAKPKNPAPPPLPPVVDPSGPVAIIDGRPLTKEMVEYQRFIDGLIDEKMGRNDAIAALLQAFTTRSVLEKKFKAFDPSMLKDEHEWLKNRTADTKLVDKIRNHRGEQLFLDVYVGANGLYKRKLQEVFGKNEQDELRRRAAEVLKEVQEADGVERPGPKIEGVRKEECCYSFAKSEFIGKFDTEAAEQIKANPKDPLAPKLAKLKVNTALPEIQWGDMNALIIRRVQDDFKQRPVYETYRVVKDGVYSAWFKRQCKEMVIEIPDPALRREMLDLAKDVTHIIKVK